MNSPSKAGDFFAVWGIADAGKTRPQWPEMHSFQAADAETGAFSQIYQPTRSASPTPDQFSVKEKKKKPNTNFDEMWNI